MSSQTEPPEDLFQKAQNELFAKLEAMSKIAAIQTFEKREPRFVLS